MNQKMLVFAMLGVSAAILSAQNTGQSSQYQGVSNPPPDSTIQTEVDPAPAPAQKPAPGQPMTAQPAAAQQVNTQQAPDAVLASAPVSAAVIDGTDDGIVQVAPSLPEQPVLSQRTAGTDPDGDIVHPAPPPPGQLSDGTVIRVRLLDGLSTTESRAGDKFRSRVASDVIQNGQLLIPAGAEIDGTVATVSAGHLGGHGAMYIRPQTVILSDGSRYQLYAQLTGTPGSNTSVRSEGAIVPASRLRKDGIEYGGAAGAGAITGAILGGPGGALAGTLIGAGVITAHLLVSHPQATLDPGTVLLFTLNQPLNLVSTVATGN